MRRRSNWSDRRRVWLARAAWGVLLMCATSAELGAEQQANYDESRVPAYTLPDPLLDRQGHAVATAAEWQSHRRDEVLELFRTQVYGRAPQRPEGMSFAELDRDERALDGKALRRTIAISLAADKTAPVIRLTLYQPRQAAAPVPVCLGIHLFDTSQADPVPGKLWEPPSDATALAALRDHLGRPLVPPGAGLLEAILGQGFAVGTLNVADWAPDSKENWRQGAIDFFDDTLSAVPADERWGTIAAWAWGLSRAQDYLETDPSLDAGRTIVMGHSRMGKTALWAGATDERFAVVISNNSGCGGAALSRRRYGETVARINRVFPHWFCDRFNQYNDHEDALPIDQHELIALAAPRPVYVASAQDDGWADPRGEFLAALGAEPVYRLLGQSGLGTSDLPPVNQPVGGRIGYHLRTGPHALSDYDWMQYLSFARRELGLPAE